MMTTLEIEEQKRRVVLQDDFRKLMRGFAGFQMATALVVAAKAPDVFGASIVVSLFAFSIPATIVFGGLARLTKEDEARNPSHIALLCAASAFLPSMAALSLLLWPASRVAAVLFPLFSFVWTVVVVRLRLNQEVQAAPK